MGTKRTSRRKIHKDAPRQQASKSSLQDRLRLGKESRVPPDALPKLDCRPVTPEQHQQLTKGRENSFEQSNKMPPEFTHALPVEVLDRLGAFVSATRLAMAEGHEEEELEDRLKALLDAGLVSPNLLVSWSRIKALPEASRSVAEMVAQSSTIPVRNSQGAFIPLLQEIEMPGRNVDLVLSRRLFTRPNTSSTDACSDLSAVLWRTGLSRVRTIVDRHVVHNPDSLAHRSDADNDWYIDFVFEMKPELGPYSGAYDRDTSYELGAALALLAGAYQFKPNQVIAASGQVREDGRIVELDDCGDLIARKCRLIVSEVPELQCLYVATADRPHALQVFKSLKLDVDIVGIERLEELVRRLRLDPALFSGRTSLRLFNYVFNLARAILSVGLGTPRTFMSGHTDQELRFMLLDTSMAELITFSTILLLLAGAFFNTPSGGYRFVSVLTAFSLPSLLCRYIIKHFISGTSTEENSRKARLISHFELYSFSHATVFITCLLALSGAYLSIPVSNVSVSSKVSQPVLALIFVVVTVLYRFVENAVLGVAVPAALIVVSRNSGSADISKEEWRLLLLKEFGDEAVLGKQRQVETFVFQRFLRSLLGLQSLDSFTKWEQFPLGRIFWHTTLVKVLGVVILARCRPLILWISKRFLPLHEQVMNERLEGNLHDPNLDEQIKRWSVAQAYTTTSMPWALVALSPLYYVDPKQLAPIVGGLLAVRSLLFVHASSFAPARLFLYFWGRRLAWVFAAGWLIVQSSCKGERLRELMPHADNNFFIIASIVLISMVHTYVKTWERLADQTLRPTALRE